jgi:thioredoxin 1
MVIYTQKLSNDTIKSFLEKPLALIDVKAEWCGPCKQLSPIIDEVSYEAHDKLSVGVIDADENMDFCKEHNVRNIPTLLLFKNGELVDRTTGLKSKKDILEMVEKYS